MSAEGAGPTISVCLVEDNHDLRAMLKQALRDAGGFRCVGSYPDAETALPNILQNKPDVAVIDMELPGMSGGELIQRVKEQAPQVRALVLTGIPGASVFAEAIKAGADGFWSKAHGGRKLSDLLNAIREVQAGGNPMDAKARRLAWGILGEFDHNVSVTSMAASVLTPREREVMELEAKGLTDKEIADQLDVSLNTVIEHNKHIHLKLGVHSRLQAVTKFLGPGARVER